MTTNDIPKISDLKAGALTVCVGPSTGLNISSSLQVAEHLARETSKGNVLYLNTVQPDQYLYSSIRKHVNKDFSIAANDSRITYQTSMVGLITADKQNLEIIIKENEIKFVIINSWEFASKDYRRKEELIFMIMGWLQQYKMTVLVFAEKMKNAPESEKIQRGAGIGKLSAAAKEIKILTEPLPEVVIEEDLFDSVEVTPIVDSYIWTPRNIRERNKVVQLYCDTYTAFEEEHEGEPWEKKCEIVMKQLNEELESKQWLIKQWVHYNQQVQSRLNAERNFNKMNENQLPDEFVGSEENEVSLHYGPDKLPVRIEEKNRVREKLM